MNTRRRRRLRSLIAALTAGTVVAIAAATSAQAKIVATRCGFATMIAIRGTNEPAGTGSANGGRTYASGGFGSTISSMASYMDSDPNLPFYIEGLAYPAVALDLLNLASPTYVNSQNQGIANLRNEIENLASSCPSTNIVLAGYSQGASIITNTLAGNGGSLSASAKNHIAAVVMFGNPDYYPGEAWNAPGSPSGNGMFGGLGSPGLSAYKRLTWNSDYTAQVSKTTIRSYCFAGDMFCQNNPAGAAIHGSYATNYSTMLAAYTFIYNWLTSTD